MEETLYSKCQPEDINPYVIFCGDPGRVNRVVQYLDDFQKINENREFATYSGDYKGVDITVTSTGIGGPSAAIAVEEMAECGMKVAIRIGTIMGLGETKLGELVIPSGCMRKENTSKTYVPAEYPAVADPLLVQKMVEAAKQKDLAFKQGVICSYDGFYSEMKESKLAKKLHLNTENKLDALEHYEIDGIDMESGVILTLARLLGIRGGIVNVSTVLKNLSSTLAPEERSKAEENLITVALEGIKLLAEEE